MPEEAPLKCPVDHSGLQKPAAAQCPVDHPSGASQVVASAGDACPVDHAARESWLQNMKKPQTTVSAPEAIEVDSKTCSSDKMGTGAPLPNVARLPLEREVSTIPRTGTGANWVYPSQKQFFDAMMRKEWNPDSKDMKTVVPIHNQVNERAWTQIMAWEKGQGGEACGGVQLTSFKGDSKKLTPRARWNCFWGYERPFDRHDWIVNRCGTEVEYVIDFYGGKANPQNALVPSFYLDVRPKMNTWEGFKMRLLKLFD